MKSSPAIWHYVLSVKSTSKISSIFVTFLENTNFTFETWMEYYQTIFALHWTSKDTKKLNTWLHMSGISIIFIAMFPLTGFFLKYHNHNCYALAFQHIHIEVHVF